MKILFAQDLPANELRKIGTKKSMLCNNREHFLFSLINRFRIPENELVLVSSDRSISKNETYRIDGLTIHIVALNSHGNISALFLFMNDIRRISNVIKSENADIIHAHWCYEYAEASLRADSKRTIITVHDWPDVVCPAIGNYYWRQRNKLGNRVLQKAHRFVAVSPYIGDNLKTTNSSAEILVIPDFISSDEVRAIENKICKRKNMSDPFTIITVNNGFNGIKNTESAIYAFEAFHRENPNSILKMYGADYETGGKAQRWVNENGIDTDGILFEGAVERDIIWEAFGRADLFLHTSTEESFGLVYLEAMAGRVPIIAGENSGATPWVLKDVPDVLLTDIRDAVSVKNEICKIYSGDRDNRYRTRLDRFSLELVAKEYFKLYKFAFDRCKNY